MTKVLHTIKPNYKDWKDNILEEYRLQDCAKDGISLSEFSTTCWAYIKGQLLDGVPPELIIVGKIPKEEPILKLTNYMDNAKKFWEKNPYFYDKSKLWWLWDNDMCKWEIVDEVDLLNQIDKQLKLSGETVTTHIKTNYIEAFKRVGRANIPKEAPVKWVQFKDKAFSLESGKTYEVKPNYLFTNPIPWEIGESSDTPTMDKLFKEWVGEKYVKTLYEIIAYCCYRDYPIHRIFALIGSGCNGKSKFQQLLKNFIHLDNATATELDILLESRFESAKLFKKLACIMGETNFGVMNKTSLLKKLSGQDLIGFEFKNKNPFEHNNYAKLLINSNSMPSSEDTSEGFYRRWLIIDFPNKFKEGRDILKDIPDKEYNNLAKKVTEILPVLLDNGSFSNEGDIKERQDRYILASNPLSKFLNEHYVEDVNGFVRYTELYKDYVVFLKSIKKRIVSKREFTKVLEMEGHEIRRTTKKINETFVNDRYIEGISKNMTVMTVVTKNSLSFPYIEASSKNSNKCHKSHKDNNPLDVVKEERIYHHCSICSGSEANYFHNGKPVCQNCAENLSKNGEKVEKT